MIVKNLVLGGTGIGLAIVLAGCSSTGTGNGPGLASLSASPSPVAVAAPAPIVYGAFLDGATASRLPEADRTAALGAEDGALASGERQTWKGSKGVYGFVVPGPSAPGGTAVAGDALGGECRTFTHTIYFAGRPQTGKGTGCRDAGGSWHVTS